MTRWVTIAAALATGAIVGNACLVDLEHRLACGDGYTDEAAGEECDPNDPDSFVNACRDTIRPQGMAACDPVTCEIINDRLQCAFCGDGVLDSDFVDDTMTVRLEECDGDKFVMGCPSQSGQMQCTSDCRLDLSGCDSCGNGVVDDGEECDPAAVGGVVIARPCAGDDPLPAPRPEVHPFEGGTATTCLPDCKFDRSGCTFCGNGVPEDALQTAVSVLQVVQTSDPEQCDGELVRDEALVGQYVACFTDPDLDGKSSTTANAECGTDCQTLVPREGPLCCLKTGEDCPADGEFPRCCHEYSQPDAERHCSNPFLPPGVEPPEDGGSKCN